MRLFCIVVCVVLVLSIVTIAEAKKRDRCIGGSCNVQIIKLVPVVEVEVNHLTLAPKRFIRKAIKKIAKLPGKVVKRGARRWLHFRIWRHKQLERFERRSDRKHNRKRNHI